MRGSVPEAPAPSPQPQATDSAGCVAAGSKCVWSGTSCAYQDYLAQDSDGVRSSGRGLGLSWAPRSLLATAAGGR
jgi:hypothetical protein